MAIDTRLAYLDNFSDASFRNWVDVVRAAIQAVGLVKLSAVEAAGQINTATALRPSAAGVESGFDVFRFDDALQAAAPVFVKVGYGATSSDVRCVRLRIQVGFAVDPATGNITGVISDDFNVGQNAIDNANRDMYTSGSPARLGMVLGQGGPAPFVFAIARTKDADGADTDEGVIIQSKSSAAYVSGVNYTAGVAMSQCVLRTGVQADTAARSLYTGAPAVAAGNSSLKSGVNGADIAVFPWVVPSSRGHENPALMLLSYWNANIGQLAPFVAKMYGADHTFMGFGWGFPALYTDSADVIANLVADPANGTGIAMRWE